MVDPQLRRVTEGYGILQPRVSVTMASAAGSLFARTYAGHTGVDPYTTAVSDVYQDLFGEGIFTGKGLYDVDAFMASLEGRVPENALLSHDLFEGVHARAALVTDTEVVDDYPSNVLTHARRQHRWVRGDWQILLWLFPWVPARSGLERNRLPIISRWKILDNLRRSLVPPALVALFLAGWAFLPGRPIFWTLIAMATMSFPVWSRLLELLGGPRRGQGIRVFVRSIAEDFATDLARVSVQLTFVAYQAWDMLDAVGLTLARLVSRRGRLLQWETAAAVAQRTRQLDVRGFYEAMRSSPTIAAIGALAVIAAHPNALAVALPILGLWFAAPYIAFLLSKPVPSSRPELSGDDRAYLQQLAARTWRYFETYVSDEDRWLPPDNVQFDPEPRIAHRTSPTNIAMTLLSTLSAHDLELIDVGTLVERLDATLTTVDRLEHFEGHLLNWYDTRTLEPLLPRYVSTVDSGNFAAALLALAAGLRGDGLRSSPDAADQLDATGGCARPPSSTRCTSGSSTTAGAGCSRSAIGSPTRCGAARMDNAFYDLLASEARLASFIAIAKGDVPELHWFHLGRLITACAARRCCCRGAPRCSST